MASDICSVVVTGRMTADGNLKYTNTGTAVCEFSIACNRAQKKGDEWVTTPHFFECAMFGSRAEGIQKYLTKGRQVTIQGELRQDRWQTKEGQNRSKIRIVVDSVVLGSERQGKADNQHSEGTYDPEPAFEDDVPF